jgi:hypothetical protein
VLSVVQVLMGEGAFALSRSKPLPALRAQAA